MYEIETMEIAGIWPAMKMLRIPYDRESRSGLGIGSYCTEMRGSEIDSDGEYLNLENHQRIRVNKKDIELINRAGKWVLNQIIVWAQITAPLDWWAAKEGMWETLIGDGEKRVCRATYKELRALNLFCSDDWISSWIKGLPMSRELL